LNSGRAYIVDCYSNESEDRIVKDAWKNFVIQSPQPVKLLDGNGKINSDSEKKFDTENRRILSN
jgi:hypothetical protein